MTAAPSPAAGAPPVADRRVLVRRVLLTLSAVGALVAGIGAVGTADGAGEAVLADSVLSVMLLVAYVLCRSWTAWGRLR